MHGRHPRPTPPPSAATIGPLLSKLQAKTHNCLMSVMERAALAGGKSHTARRPSYNLKEDRDSIRLFHLARDTPIYLWTRRHFFFNSVYMSANHPWCPSLYTLTLTGWKLMEICHTQMSGSVTESQYRQRDCACCILRCADFQILRICDQYIND